VSIDPDRDFRVELGDNTQWVRVFDDPKVFAFSARWRRMYQ
jgi:hypothetical protein